MRTTPQEAGHKLVAMATTVAEQRGHDLCILWPHISQTKMSINVIMRRYV